MTLVLLKVTHGPCGSSVPCLMGAAFSLVLLLNGSCPHAKADGCKAVTRDALVPCMMRCIGIG